MHRWRFEIALDAKEHAALQRLAEQQEVPEAQALAELIGRALASD